MSFSSQELFGSSAPQSQPTPAPATPAAPAPAAVPAAPQAGFSAADVFGKQAAPVSAAHYTDPGATATISAKPLTIWDRVENMFRYATPGRSVIHPFTPGSGRPNIQPEDVAANRSGEMQVFRPEELMSQTEQKEHPMATAVGQAAGGMTSAENLAVIAGTAGFGEIPAAARGILPRLLSAGFTAQALKNAYDTYPEIKAAFNRGDESEVERLVTHAVLDLGMGAMTAQHAATAEAGAGTPSQYEKAIADRMGSPEARAGFAQYEAKTEAINNPHAPKADKKLPVFRPHDKTIAGVTSKEAASQGENPSLLTRTMGALTTPEAAKNFQEEQTPAYTQQAVNSVGQKVTDRVAAHDALVNGTKEPEPISGTGELSPYETLDDMHNAMRKSSEQTYAKADVEDAKDTAAWKQQVAEAQAKYKDLVDAHNRNITEWNGTPEGKKDPMTPVVYNPEEAQVPEKPDTYAQLKSDLQAAQANAQNADPVVRQKAFDTEIPKAEKAIDGWFADHSDAISNAEYQSARRLRADSEKVKTMAQMLRQPILDGTLSSGKMSSVEATINKKSVKAGRSENSFAELLGPDGYKNWNSVKELFQPIDTGSGKSWGTTALAYVAENLLGHIIGIPASITGVGGVGTALATSRAMEWFSNKVMFDPEFGSWFKDAANAMKDAGANLAQGVYSLPGALRNRFISLVDKYKASSEKGMAGADINKPRFGRAGLGGKAITPSFDLEKGETDAEGVAHHTIHITDGDKHIGILNVEQQTPDSWTIKDSAVTTSERGKGYGRAAYQQAFKEAQAAGMKTVESDISSSKAALGTWASLAREFPDAITEENGQYTADLTKMTQAGNEAALKDYTHGFPASGLKETPQGTLETTPAGKSANTAWEAAHPMTPAPEEKPAGGYQPNPVEANVVNKGRPDQATLDQLKDSAMATRIPTTKDADLTNNGIHSRGMDAIKEADAIKPTRVTANGDIKPGYAQTMADKLASYPDTGVRLTAKERAQPMKVIQKYVDHFKTNLKSLYDAVPDVIRNAAGQWYESAHYLAKRMGEQYGVTHEQAAAVIAALSPQNFWDNNAGIAERFIKHWSDAKGHLWDPEMEAQLDRVRGVQTDKIAKDTAKGQTPSLVYTKMLDEIRGKGYNDLAKLPDIDTASLRRLQGQWLRIFDEAHGNPNVPLYSPDGSIRGTTARTHVTYDMTAKAIDMLEGGGDLQHLHEVMGEGHKIRNFYNNIINPWSDEGHVTIDTHAVGAAWGKPVSGNTKSVVDNFSGAPSEGSMGIGGTYPVYEEAYRQAAKELGIPPRELQSVTWEAIRSLFDEQDKKSDVFRKAIDDIWKQVEKGKLSQQDAMKQVIERSGGFKKPDWVTDEQWAKDQQK